MRKGFLMIATLGVLAPYAAVLPWLSEHGLDVELLGDQLLANPLSTFLVADIVVSAAVVFFLAAQGLRRGDLRMMWPIIGTLTVGASLGLPLYLILSGGDIVGRSRRSARVAA